MAGKGKGNGGFGRGPFGGSPFGGSVSLAGTPSTTETLTLTEVLTVVVPLRLTAVTSLSPFLVKVEFSHDIDLGFAGNFLVTSYTISSPALSVLAVFPGLNQNEVILQTAEQGATTYLLTVNVAQSAFGDPIDLANNTGLFSGFGSQPTFFATAQSDRKVQLTFSTTIDKDATFLDAATYSVKEVDGTTVTIDSVESPTDTNIPPFLSSVTRLVINLGEDLKKGNSYVVEILGTVKSNSGVEVFPTTDLFRWDRMDSTITVPIANFSGEVSGGILGTPAGQVYVSPALNVPFANSSIQVDSVEVCTRAFDVYTIPEIPDPQPLATFGGAVTTLLNTTNDVLWATAERLGLARTNLSGWSNEDTWPGPAVDGPADATLVETIDIDRAAFLNDLRWLTSPGDLTATSLFSTSFDGVDDYVTMGDATELKFTNTDPFSISFWFKSTQVGSPRLVAKREFGGNNRGYEVQMSSGALIFQRINLAPGDVASITTDASSFNDGQWHHVVATTDGTDASGMAIYVDGASEAVTPITDALTGTIDTTADFQISGLDGTNFPYEGLIDDVAVYDVDLTSTEVTTIYNSGDPPDLRQVGPSTSLVGYWRMGDYAVYPIIPDYLIVPFPDVPDKTVSGFDGTMTNMAASDITPTAIRTSHTRYSTFTSGWFNAGNDSSLDFEVSDEFTLSCWVKGDPGGSERTYMSKAASGGLEKGYSLYLNTSGNVGFKLTSVTATSEVIIETTATIDSSAWHHLAVTWDGTVDQDASNAIIYIDGVAQSVTVVANTLSGTTLNSDDFNIGARSTLLRGNAYQADASVHNTALSAGDITTIYNGGLPLDLRGLASASSLVSYWRCGDGDHIFLGFLFGNRQLGATDRVLPSGSATFPSIPDGSSWFHPGTLNNMEAGDVQGDTPGGISSYSCDFDGVDEYMSSSDFVELERGTDDPFTLSFWVKTTAATGFCCGKFADLAAYYGFGVDLSGGKPRLIITSNITLWAYIARGDLAINDGAWHHVVVTHTPLGQSSPALHDTKFYIDGALVATVEEQNDQPATTINNSNGFTVGGIGPTAGQFIQAKFDEVAYYHSALTTAQVGEVYNGGAPPNLRDLLSSEAFLVGWWRMGDAAGNDAPCTGMSQSRKSGDAPGLGPFSTHCLNFDGNDDRVDMGNVLDKLRTDAFSISAWIKWDVNNGAEQTIVAKRTSTASAGYSFIVNGLNDVGLGFRFTDGAAGEILVYAAEGRNQGVVLPNVWTHVVVTYDGSSTAAGVTFYANGWQLQNFEPASDTLAGATSNAVSFTVGDLAGGSGAFQGDIDEVAVFDTELSAAQVDLLWNSGAPGNLEGMANLEAWWRMAEGGNDGVMTNMAGANFSSAVTGGVFRTADNLTSIGSGPTVNVNLQP